jgi:hypothetical protein
MSNKKAQGMQFNWIFVIIAGSIILAFFVMFTVKYIDLQNKKVSARIANSIESSLDSLKTAEVHTEIGNVANINFRCDKFYVNNYLSMGLSEKLIFAPESINGNIVAWLQEWEYPFSVGNLFYLSGKDDEFVFSVSGGLDPYEIKNRIPDDFNVEFRNSDYDILIIPSEDDPYNGYVKIEGVDYPYFGRAMLYGAIFSDNYGCLLERSLEELNKITRVYIEKAKILRTGDCSDSYHQVYVALNKLSESIEQENYQQIFKLKKQIENMNKDLDGRGCVVVF